MNILKSRTLPWLLCIVTLLVFLISLTLIRDNTRNSILINKQIQELQQYKISHDKITHISAILEAYPLHGVEPYVYACLVDSVARKYNVHWEAIVATIDIETGRTWDPTQTSSANCVGIMQFSEKTAKMVAKRVSLPYERNITVWSEIAAIELGTAYLAEGIANHTYENGFKHYVGGSNFGNVAKALTKKKSKKEKARLLRINNYIIYYNDIVKREYRKLCLMSGRIK